jgi:hypothetical protein
MMMTLCARATSPQLPPARSAAARGMPATPCQRARTAAAAAVVFDASSSIAAAPARSSVHAAPRRHARRRRGRRRFVPLGAAGRVVGRQGQRHAVHASDVRAGASRTPRRALPRSCIALHRGVAPAACATHAWPLPGDARCCRARSSCGGACCVRRGSAVRERLTHFPPIAPNVRSRRRIARPRCRAGRLHAPDQGRGRAPWHRQPLLQRRARARALPNCGRAPPQRAPRAKRPRSRRPLASQPFPLPLPLPRR